MNFVILGSIEQDIKGYERVISESLLGSKIEYHKNTGRVKYILFEQQENS